MLIILPMPEAEALAGRGRVDRADWGQTRAAGSAPCPPPHVHRLRWRGADDQGWPLDLLSVLASRKGRGVQGGVHATESVEAKRPTHFPGKRRHPVRLAKGSGHMGSASSAGRSGIGRMISMLSPTKLEAAIYAGARRISQPQALWATTC